VITTKKKKEEEEKVKIEDTKRGICDSYFIFIFTIRDDQKDHL
jgi:hypothetical protein